MKHPMTESRTLPTQIMVLSAAGILFALALAGIAGATWLFSVALRAACSG